MIIISDKKNKVMDVVDVYIKPRKVSGNATTETTKDFMLMGVPYGMKDGHILGVYETYEEAHQKLMTIAKEFNAYAV